jgi:molybdate transport system regulatory protein
VHARILAQPHGNACLDALQLARLEQAFRQWWAEAGRLDVRSSRRRIVLLFLLIRYTGAKLSEALAFNPLRDIDTQRQSVSLRKPEDPSDRPAREVQIPQPLLRELQQALAAGEFTPSPRGWFAVDPAHVRRKFYERAAQCGYPKQMGAPDMIRKSRAIELLQENVPLPVVQRMLGHTTPNLTAAYVAFAEEEIQQVARAFLEREAHRKTSARNRFFGKVRSLRQGDIQTQVELVTLGGHRILTLITNDSVKRLGLKAGALVTAEVKAPWVMLQRGEPPPRSSADNCLRGEVTEILRGRVTCEVRVALPDGGAVCAVIAADSARHLALRRGDAVWVLFSGIAVVLHAD